MGRNCPGTESLLGAKKSQQCHQHFFQNSTFASERPQVRTQGGKLVSCSRRHLTSLRPCTSRLSNQNGKVGLQNYLTISGKLSIKNYLKQNALDYRRLLTIENNLKVKKKVYYVENKHNFPSPQKLFGVCVETNMPKNQKAIIMLALCPGRCLLHRKGIENDQSIFFHVTAGNVKFAFSQ